MGLVLLIVLAATGAAVAGLGVLAGEAASRRDLQHLLSAEDLRGASGLRRRLDRRLATTRLGIWTQLTLDELGIRSLRVVDAVALVAGVTVALVVLVGVALSWLLSPLVVCAVVPAVLALVRRQQGRRKEKFIAQMPQLARILSNAAQAGLSIRTAVEIAAEEMPEPAAGEMARVAQSLSVGESLERALRALENRLPAREVAVLVSTLVVSSRAGGSLISSLRKIAETLEERKQTRREVQTMLAEARSSAFLIPVIGIGALLIINSLGENVIDHMLRKPIGQVIFVVALVMYVVGGLLFRRATRIES